jgi:hypothetical protein
MTTTILSNGSKWAGQEPNGLEKLYEVLVEEILEPRFEHHGGLVARREGGPLLFFGNFVERSYAFRVETDEPVVIARLEALIAANLARPEYARARAEYLASCNCRQCKPEQWGPARPIKYSWESPRP